MSYKGLLFLSESHPGFSEANGAESYLYHEHGEGSTDTDLTPYGSGYYHQ